MSLPETYYTVAFADDNLPAQYEWDSDLEAVKEYALVGGRDDNNTHIVYEIMVRPLYRTRTTVELEKI